MVSRIGTQPKTTPAGWLAGWLATRERWLLVDTLRCQDQPGQATRRKARARIPTAAALPAGSGVCRLCAGTHEPLVFLRPVRRIGRRPRPVEVLVGRVLATSFVVVFHPASVRACTSCRLLSFLCVPHFSIAHSLTVHLIRHRDSRARKRHTPRPAMCAALYVCTRSEACPTRQHRQTKQNGYL